MIPSPWPRLAAALGLSVLLHAAALLALRALAPSPRPAESQMNVSLVPLSQPAPRVPQAAAGTRPKPEQQKEAGARTRPSQPPRPGPAESTESVIRRGAGVSIAPVSAPRDPPASGLGDAASYRTTERLRVQPDLAGPLRVRYPRLAFEQRRKAVVVLQLMIDEGGVVMEALAMPGPGEDFVAAAREALRGARFTPAQSDGGPVRARAFFAVSFSIE